MAYPIIVVTNGSRQARDAALAERVRRAAVTQIRELAPTQWPFRRQLQSDIRDANGVVLIARRIDDAFPDAQTGGTRLVLTQSTYQLQRWLDWIDGRDNVTMLADADSAALRHAAPEAFHQRGPWSRVELITLPDDDANEPQRTPEGNPLLRAFLTNDPEERLALCRREAESDPQNEVVQLALGSAYMELQDLDASQAAIERAIALSPAWEAAHFELGKLFLRRDDLERASRAFAEAGRLMPTFSAAFSNLGATLGELDRSDEALEAFRQALKYDPNGYTVLNNLGVVFRELGRLRESEDAFRRVVSLAPEFVFGHYNLGHTLFLQGRYQASVSAYAEGQRRDPERNARQACRLAIVRLAAGDAAASLQDLRRCVIGVPSDQKREILAEAQEILWALLTDRPDLAGWKQISDLVKSELERL